MKKVKFLAKKVIDERSDLQRFFIEALDHVRKQIQSSRNNFVKSAKSHYHSQMAAAANKKGMLPPVKTFGYNPNSTHAVDKDLQEAEHFNNVTPNTELSDLTWEQKGKCF
jgi:aspartate/tyrosine/aromatic aminotransferase